jgi:hypothetical protein
MGRSDAAADEYWAGLEHPMAESARGLRAALLDAAPGVAETLKWKAPNFATVDDFATFNFRRPTAVQVILHTGAKPKPEHPEITVDAPAGLLRWADRNRAVVTFGSSDQILEHRDAFATLVSSWAAQLR